MTQGLYTFVYQSRRVFFKVIIREGGAGERKKEGEGRKTGNNKMGTSPSRNFPSLFKLSFSFT